MRRTASYLCFLLIVCHNVNIPAFGQETLPSTLTLQCSGEAKKQIYAPVRRPIVSFESESFSIQIRIRNRQVVDLSKNELLGADCVIVKGQIGCDFESTRYIERDRMTEKKTGIVLLSRETGALQMLHGIFFFSGHSQAADDLNASEKIQREGICTTISTKPLF